MQPQNPLLHDNTLSLPALLFLTLFLSTACRHDSRTGRILDQADSLLATRPDSALHLLERHADRLPPHSTRECARYALLLARALDKCEQPLEPCDSLYVIRNFG